jgi:CheY-like chemotaxis protein
VTVPARILIVDDDPIVGQTFSRMLGVSGYDVDVVLSAEAGLEHAGQRVPDAILMDMRMPVMDGAGLLARVRRDEKLREVPVAVITGDHFLSDEALDQLRAYGATIRFKPLMMNDLLALVRGLLAGK